MIHLYTGEGKGKTTAAIGLAVRAAAYDAPVIFSQFMKGGNTGELSTLAKLGNVQILRSEKDFGFYHQMSEEDKQELTQIHNGILRQLLQAADEGRGAVMILDEITYPVKWKLLDLALLEKLLRRGCEECELVLTGRNPAPFLVEAADYVTEMRCVRHPFEKGVTALRTFCELRTQSVRGQLDGSIPSTDDGQSADDSASVDASSLTLSDMGNMGFGGGRRNRNADASPSDNADTSDAPAFPGGFDGSDNGFPGGFGGSDNAFPGGGLNSSNNNFPGNWTDASASSLPSTEAWILLGVSVGALLAGLLVVRLYRRRPLSV